MHEQQPDHDQRNHVHSPSLWSQVAADVATSKPLVPAWTETVNKADLEDLLNKNQPDRQLQTGPEMAAMDASKLEGSLAEPEEQLNKRQVEPMELDEPDQAQQREVELAAQQLQDPAHQLVLSQATAAQSGQPGQLELGVREQLRPSQPQPQD